MDSRKNKIFLAVVVILGAIIVLMFVVNKFSIVQKVEKFVDDESEEGEEGYEDEENETEEKESFDEKTQVQAKPSSQTMKDEPKVEKKQSLPVEDKTKTNNEDVKPINDLSTKFRKLIDEMDKQLKNKAVSDDIKKKVMTELMGSIETFSKIGDDTSSLISTIIQKYIPKTDNFTETQVVPKSMDTIKKYLTDALAEIERMESKNSTVMSNVNERFVPSRDVPVPMEKQKQDVVEGFENTPHYALY